MVFKDGSREPLHGHNYKISVKGDAPKLTDDMVFDFLDIKPIVRDACNELDHRLLLPQNNPHLKIETNDKNYVLKIQEDTFSIPIKDCLILPIPNTSAENLSYYFAHQIQKRVFEKFKFKFSQLEIEVEETPGQSALYILKD